jgi:hypothetical protein
VFDKILQLAFSMPRGQASSSRSYGTHALVARPSIQSRKLILETSFAIKEDFTNFETTSWAIQELKHHGLKRLFKPVTSTAYERLVWSFYENLTYDYKQPHVLSSPIDDRDIEVTLADIAVALKCHAKRPEVDNQWIACPSMLTTEDNVVDMCEGQFANQYKNAARKQSCLHNSGLWTSYYRVMCVLWDTKHRDGTFSSLPYIHFTRAIGAPFPISSGGSCINSRRECTNELLTPPEVGDYRSRSLSPICSERMA